MANIKFGTDGWRAVLDRDFTEENFKLAAEAIAKYIYDNFGLAKNIIIGYDTRRMADFYAGECAKLFASKGFKVKLSNRVVPTPVIAYSAGAENSCAVMFTASHNPPEYLGMKFIPDYAGPATDDITSEIMSNIGKNLSQNRGGDVEVTDFADKYKQRLAQIIDFKRIKSAKIPFIYDGLFSAAIGYFDKILDDNGIKYDSIHMVFDSDFGGGMPDPKPQYIKDLMEKCRISHSIGFANDGDGDRFGVVNEYGEYVSPNEIIPLIAQHLILHKGVKGAIVKTAGSSMLIDKAAEKLNIPIIETAVGFKHIGAAMRKNEVIIGGEESGGLSIGVHIPEKDGILANLLILEMLAYSGKSLKELCRGLYELTGTKFYTERIDIKLSDRKEIDKILDYYKTVKSIGLYEVTKKTEIDGVKLYLGSDTTILIRPSGTEPLLRIYFESKDKSLLDELKKINFTECR